MEAIIKLSHNGFRPCVLPRRAGVALAWRALAPSADFPGSPLGQGFRPRKKNTDIRSDLPRKSQIGFCLESDRSGNSCRASALCGGGGGV